MVAQIGARRFMAIVGLLVGCLCAISSVQGQEADLSVESLREKWAAMNADVVNGAFRVVVYRASGISELPQNLATEQSFEAEFEQIHSTDDFKKFLDVYQKHFETAAESFSGGTPVWGQVIEIRFDGDYCRNTWFKATEETIEDPKTENAQSHNAPIRDYLWTPNGFASYNPQFDTFTLRFDAAYEKIDKFALLNLPLIDASNVVSIMRSDDALRVEMKDRLEMEVQADGFITKLKRSSDSGVELWLYGREVREQLFPQWSVRAFLPNGELSQFFATEVRSGKTNINLPATTFDVTVKRGQRVIDLRRGTENQQVFASDVPMGLFELVSRPEKALNLQASSRRSYFSSSQFIVICGLAVVFAALLFFSRRLFYKSEV